MTHPTPTTERHDPIEAARAGTNPTVLHRLPSGWAVIGDYQRLPGYCVLLHDGNADQLHDLPPAEQAQFLQDMAVLGRAVAQACSHLDPHFARVNYAILGNAYGRLHAHIHAGTAGKIPSSDVSRSGATPTASSRSTGSAPNTARFVPPSPTRCSS